LKSDDPTGNDITPFPVPSTGHHGAKKTDLTKRDEDVIKLDLNAVALLAALVISAAPASAQQAAAAADEAPLDVHQLFASTCGWCHSGGGRVAGKGPQLMDSPRSDEFLHNRIKMGKQGAMPAFGESYTDPQIDEIVKYIRTLKPE
jgi:mono/diheme cytochrome c family protein